MQIFKNILFIFILVILLTGISGWMDSAAKNEDLVHGRNKSISRIRRESDQTIDVLVMGDSLSYSSIAPLILWKDHGITSYVCGQPGQKIQETYYLLKAALEKQSPRLLILETNVLFRGQGKLDGLKESVAEAGNYHFPIFRFHDIWKPLLMEKLYKEENYKGFEIRDGIKPYEEEDYMKESLKKKEMGENVEGYMERIVEMCREKNVEILLLSTPSPRNYNYRKHNTLAEYAKKQNLSYMNMNMVIKEIGIDWHTDSLDKGDHLNLSGACKVTAYLGEYLDKSEWKLPDHRGDAALSAWEKEAEEFEQKVTEKLKVMRGK